MSYERLEQAINDVVLAEKTLKDNVSLFKQYITDSSIPLSQRWQFWRVAPSSLKSNDGYIGDGRLEAFNILGVKPRDALGYQNALVCADRYETITMEGMLDCINENWFDCDDGRDFDKIPEGINWDNFDFEADTWPEFPVLSEFNTAFKEEVLRKNIQSFKFDW